MARDRRSAEEPGRRAVLALILTAALAFVVVGAGASVAAHRIARADALADALRTAHGFGNAIFVRRLPAVVAGNADASAELDADVTEQRADGSLVRATVWQRDGTVLWSDDHALIGHTYPLARRVATVFDSGGDYANIASPTSGDSQDERGRFTHLVEAYVPVTLPNGNTLAVEMYFSDTRLRLSESELSARIVPFALLALLVLAVAQLPVSIWLVRRITATQRDRDRMLDTVLVSAERERRVLARNLHDGVVQELAGAAFLLESRSRSDSVPAETRHAMGVVSQTLHRSVGDLRDMLVELHPQELNAGNLGELIEAAAVRACPEQVVTVFSRLERPVSTEVAAFLYRCARECATNVAKHAKATRVEISVTSDADAVRLLVQDDGVGIADTALDRTDGHLGLVLLRDAATDLGGSLHARGDDGGTLITITLPPD